MKLSTDRILTTHVGSLPRPQEVVDYLFAQDRGENYDPAEVRPGDPVRRARTRCESRWRLEWTW